MPQREQLLFQNDVDVRRVARECEAQRGMRASNVGGDGSPPSIEERLDVEVSLARHGEDVGQEQVAIELDEVRVLEQCVEQRRAVASVVPGGQG